MMRILIATDAPLMGEAWGEYLVGRSDLPIEVTVCAIADITMRAALLHPYMIFLDLHKLVHDGLDILSGIRRTAPEAKIILIVDGAESQAYFNALLHRGVKGLLSLNSPLAHMTGCLRTIVTRNVYVSQSLRPRGWPQDGSADYSPNGLFSLTPRELHVARLLTSGLTAKQIGAAMGITSRTVDVHRHNILKKLGVPKTVNLVNLWMESDFPLHRV
jgi:two-component system invasion response regulator UvrY